MKALERVILSKPSKSGLIPLVVKNVDNKYYKTTYTGVIRYFTSFEDVVDYAGFLCYKDLYKLHYLREDYMKKLYPDVNLKQ
jgi:hypothetical protein